MNCRVRPISRRHSRAGILGVGFDLIDYESAIETLHSWREAGRCGQVVMCNPHSVLTCHRDSAMARSTAAASLVLPDGAGIILAARILGYPRAGRVAGPTLMLRLCDWGRRHGYRHYFYGGAEGVADTLADRLASRYPGLEVAGTLCPPFRPVSEEEDLQIVERINASRPDVVWVGLGAPKQEKWMLEHSGRIHAPAMVGVGAAFDFHSGRIAWAPTWVRRIGMEWAYRLAREPGRMWRRNLDSPLFLLRVLRQKAAMLLGENRAPVLRKPASL
jgi:N-acetylglucosaminyldiphosphoundecaprenol N-acetyl-beta-D-mannosaminyltransferase